MGTIGDFSGPPVGHMLSQAFSERIEHGTSMGRIRVVMERTRDGVRLLAGRTFWAEVDVTESEMDKGVPEVINTYAPILQKKLLEAMNGEGKRS